MAREISNAFAHPYERSADTGADFLDRLSVRDHILSIEIGAFESERGIEQRVCFNVVVEVKPVTQEIDDDVDRILSYDKVTDAIVGAAKAERYALLETLAENVAHRILLEPQAVRVFVRIEKLDRGASKLGVEIVRSDHTKPSATTQRTTKPTILFFAKTVLRDVRLVNWVEAITKTTKPVIVLSEVSDAEVDPNRSLAIRKNLNLLEMDKCAWRFSGLSPDFVVASSKTELDWGLENNQISIWAPKRMLLDATDPLVSTIADSQSAFLWLGAKMGAQEMVAVDEALEWPSNVRQMSIEQSDAL